MAAHREVVGVPLAVLYLVGLYTVVFYKAVAPPLID